MNKPYDVIKIDKNTKKIQTPNLLLTTRSFNVIGKISNFNNWKISLVGNGVDEISFDVHKYVNGKLCPIWDDLVDLKIVQVMEFGNFEISVDYTDNTETVKAVHGKSLEVELAQIPLNDFHVNDDEAMTMKQTEYNAIDFDENGKFIPTKFYNPKDENHSLLHRVLKDKAQHWSIGEVTPYIAIDEETQRELSSTFQRTYTCDGTSIYDFLTGDVAKESNVIFIFDTLHRKINCYSLCDCVDLKTGDVYKGVGEDTTVFVSKRKLTNEITISSNKDNVKNCFRVEGGDDTITTMIGAVNMNGSNYIYQFADFQYNDMSKELVEKIKAYQKMISSQELQDEYYGYGDIKRFINGTLTLNVRSEDEAALALALCSSNNVSTGTANIMTYINTPYWYVIDGKRGKELCVSSTKTTPLLYATTAYDTMGIYPKLCVQYDMLEYFESSMMPSVTISDTTAEEQYTLMKNNLTSEDTVVGIYSCGNYSDSAFLGVTDNVVAMANVVIDARYKAEVIKGTTSYTKVDDHNYTWTGNIKITRVTDETDYYPKTDDDSNLTFSVKISDDELTYTKQKIEKALSKGSMLDIDFDVAEMNETEIRNYFNRYSLNKLNGFQEGYNNCLSTLMSMRSDSDVKNTLYNSYKTRFNIVSELYTNRQSQVDNVNKTIFDLDIERSNFINEKKLRLQDYLGDKLYKEFSSYRREDSYKNDNYISDGYSTAQCLEKAKELLEVAQKEAKKACVLQRTVSCNLNNLFAIPEFEPLYDKLALFNYIRIRTEDEILKLRLIEVDFSGDSVDKIEVTFSEQIETVDGKTSDLESILQQASTMATSYSSTTLQAKKGEDARNKLLDLYYGGLNATNIMLSNNDNNEVTITSAGLIAKRMDDEGYYGDKQLRITGNGVYLTKDAWKHVEMAIGEVFFNGSWQYGVLAPLVGKMIAGNNLVIQDENGTVKIDGNGIILSKGAKIKWSVDGSDGVKAPDIDDIKGLPKKLDGINDYLEQLDGRIQTFTQNTNPRDDSSWGDDSSHIGDLWVNPDTGITKQWTGNGWIEVTDSYLKSLAASKAQIFTEKPTVSYFKGDMLIPAKTFENNGRTYYAKKGYRALRNSNGTTFSNDDWDELDYTNDDAINNFIKGDYAETIEDIKTQVDGKARSWYQSEDPSLSWDKTEDHEGDLWYNTSTTSQVTLIYKNGGWQPTNVPKAVFDTIDGKRQIFVKKPDSILTVSGNNVITNNISCKNGDTIVLECTTYTSIKASFYDSSDTEISVYLVRSSIPLAKTINIPIDAENVEYAIITINDSSKSDVKSLKVNGTEYIIPISYMTGDLWIISESDCTNGKITVNGVTYNSNSTLIAILPNNVTERTSFVESDWTDISTQDGIVALDQSTQALNKFDDIANDSKITPTEKQQLKILFENIEAEKVSIVNNCKEYSMDSLTSAYYSDYDAYISAFNNLETLFGTILSDMKSTINVPSNYSSVTKSYYDKYDVINTDIEKASKSYADKKSGEVDTKILYFQANVNKLLNADLPLTDTGDDYIFSPYIGGGYLYIEGDSGSVEINPKQEKKDYIGYSGDIFNIKNSSKTTVFNVSTSGQVTIRGGNSSNSIELDGKNGTIYTINGSHKSVLTSGKLYFYENNKNMMTVTPTAWNPKPDVKGTALHSEVDSKFISFGNKNSSYDTSYTTNLILNYGLNPYKISNDPSSGEIDKNVIIFGTTYHSSNVYFNNNSYIGSSSSNYNGIYVSDAIKSPRVYAGNYVHGDYALDVNGNAYLSGSITFGDGNNAYLNGITSGGVCCSGSFGVNGGGYTGYALGVTGDTYVSSNLVVIGNANLGSVTCSDLGLWVTTSGQRFSAKYCWTGSKVCFYINNDKWWYATGSFSDKRIKKNISSIPNLKDMYLALQPRQYNYIDNNIVGYESDKIHYGLIAQDTLEVMNSYGINYENQTLIKRNNTDMCTKNLVDDDYIYSIDYENLHAWHIAFSQQFYKEYNEKILQLEERLSELELEISILKK